MKISFKRIDKYKIPIILLLWFVLLITYFNICMNEVILTIKTQQLNFEFEDLGEMYISMYSHVECGGNLYTASGYKLKPSIDSQKVCAVSRDLFNISVMQGDIIYIPELGTFLTVVDTMARAHPVTKKLQLNWCDIYEESKLKVDIFGLQKLKVYRLKR